MMRYVEIRLALLPNMRTFNRFMQNDVLTYQTGLAIRVSIKAKAGPRPTAIGAKIVPPNQLAHQGQPTIAVKLESCHGIPIGLRGYGCQATVELDGVRTTVWGAAVSTFSSDRVSGTRHASKVSMTESKVKGGRKSVNFIAPPKAYTGLSAPVCPLLDII